MRVVLVGAVESTAVALRTLARQDMHPRLVVTLPPSMADRHSDFVDIASLATSVGSEVLYAADVNAPETLKQIKKVEADLILVIGWSRLCKAEFLSLAPIGTLGYHPALLPALRGRSVLSWTLLLGLETSGSTLFWIDEGTDSGDIAAQKEFSLSPDLYLGDLLHQHMLCLEELLEELLVKLKKGERPKRPQDHLLATYAARRRPEDGEIVWNQPAAQVARLVRSVSHPYPGAFTSFEGKMLRVWRASVAEYANWHAQPGQVFLYEDRRPIVRCGGATSLRLEEYQVDGGKEGPEGVLKGQVRLGRREIQYG